MKKIFEIEIRFAFFVLTLFLSTEMFAQNEVDNIGFENCFNKWNGYVCSEGLFYGNYCIMNNWGTNFWRSAENLQDNKYCGEPYVYSTSHDPLKDRFTLMTSSDVKTDSLITEIRLKSGNGSSHFVKLGNQGINIYSEKLSYQFKVTEDTKFLRYDYAFVMSQMHDRDESSYFYVTLDLIGSSSKQTEFDKAKLCFTTEFFAADSATIQYRKDGTVNEKYQPGLKLSKNEVSVLTDYSNGNPVRRNCYLLYKDWTSNLLDLSDFIGETVELSFITSDCKGSIHFAYAYVDAEFVESQFQIVDSTKCESNRRITSPITGLYGSETYDWIVRDTEGNEISNLSKRNTAEAFVDLPAPQGNSSIYDVYLEVHYPDSLIKNGCDLSVSDTITLFNCTNIRPQIEGFCENGTFRMSVDESALQDFKYQWYKDGYKIDGANKSYYEATESGKYKLQSSYSISNFISNELTYNGDSCACDISSYSLSIQNDSSNTVFCTKSNLTFYCTASDRFPNASYKWYVAGQSSTEKTPQFSFDKKGQYTIYLDMFTGVCADTMKFSLTFNVDNYNSCDKDDYAILIDDKLSGSLSYCTEQLLKFSIGTKTYADTYDTLDSSKATNYKWSFKDQHVYEPSANESFSSKREETVELSFLPIGCDEAISLNVKFNIDFCDSTACNECPSKFAPKPGEHYMVSGWVSVPSQLTESAATFTKVGLKIDFGGSNDGYIIEPSGSIIDGWQRIQQEIKIPQGAYSMRISLMNEGNNPAYYDDIRFFPFDASMKSYVYDPLTLRLVAEMDGENYATFYEYDEEGAMVRVKKETERGVMTLREARQSKPKRFNP